MIVRRFLLWARTATAGQRAGGVRILAQAYLAGTMSANDRAEAETAFLALTQDPSPAVRRALAEVLATTAQAPRSLVVALISEPGEIAALVLRNSPRLNDEELIDATAVGDRAAQCAIASREGLGAGVATVLAEIAVQDAIVALIGNHEADLPPGVFERILARFGDVPELREALLDRPDLPADLRHTIAARIAESLAGFVTQCGWLTAERAERLKRDSTERVAVDLAGQGDAIELMALVRRLRQEAKLTPALMLRALVFAEPALAEAAFADLAGLPVERTVALMYDRRCAAFPALYRKARLPDGLQEAFVAAVVALADSGRTTSARARVRQARGILERVIAICERAGSGSGGLLALLRRFEADCARVEAQALADTLADDAALMLVIEADPGLLIDDRGLLEERLARLAA